MPAERLRTSDMTEWNQLKGRLAGKWQLPVLLLSLILLPISLLRFNPPPTLLKPEEATHQIQELFDQELYTKAIELGDFFLTREPSELSVQQEGTVQLVLARARMISADKRASNDPALYRRISDHFEAASALRQKLVAKDYANWALALERQGQAEQAILVYNEALKHEPGDSLDIEKHVLDLKMDLPDAKPQELVGEVEAFIEKLGRERLDLRMWGLERLFDLHGKLGTTEEFASALDRNRQYFADSDLWDHFQYLQAYLLYRTGRNAEAETLIRAVRNRIGTDDPLYARTGWLLGRVVLSDGMPQRPQEALSFFEDVLIHQPRDPYAVACRVGRAEALAMLERHDEALASYRTAIEEMLQLSDGRPVSRRALRTSLGLQAETQRQAGRLAEAVRYAELAVSLTDDNAATTALPFLQQLGQLQYLLAESLDHRPENHDLSAPPQVGRTPVARQAFLDAADTYNRIAKLSSVNETRAAAAAWRVAECKARAGEWVEASKLFADFAADRPDHPLAPRSLLRIGQLQQAAGQFSQALDAYRECYRRFPRLLDSSRALVPMAQCYMAMGSDHLDQAEKTLRIVLRDSEVFTPQAPEFADALFLLGEVLHRQHQQENAIATLEEALARYPDDPRGPRARFLLADSFRQSGLALKADAAEAQYTEQMQQLRSDAATRFATARGLFHQMIGEYEKRAPETLTASEQVYLRCARLYEADCAFENRDYREALKLYEQAVGLYQNTTSALAAYVQIINSYVFLGESDEARAALARARVLVNSVPDSAFSSPIAPEGREDWKRYFEWLERAELF